MIEKAVLLLVCVGFRTEQPDFVYDLWAYAVRRMRRGAKEPPFEGWIVCCAEEMMWGHTFSKDKSLKFPHPLVLSHN